MPWIILRSLIRESRFSKVLNRSTSKGAARAFDLLESFALYALAVATPLFAIPGVTEAYRTPKEALVRAAIILYVTAWVLKRIWAEDLVASLRALRGVPAFLPFTGLVIWTFLAGVLSPSSRSSTEIPLNIALFYVFYGLSFLEWAPVLARRWITLALVAGVFNGALMCIQRAKIPLGGYLAYNMNMHERYRMGGLIGNPHDVGNYLALLFLLACAAVFIVRRWYWKALFLGALSLFALLLAWNETYTAIVALLVALLSSCDLLALRRSALRFPFAVLVIILFISGGTSAWHISKDPDARNRFARTFSALKAGDWNEFLHGRYIPWHMALEMIRDRPLWGHGPGIYGYLSFDYQIEFIRAHPQSRLRPEEAYFDQTHNDYLQDAAETGIPALFLVGWIAVSYLRAANKALTHVPEGERPAAGPGSGARVQSQSLLPGYSVLPLLGIAFVVAMIIGGFAGFPFRLAITMSLLVPVAGMSLSRVTTNNEATDEHR